MPNSEELRSAPLSVPIELQSGRPARIVVADDDRLARQMLANILQKAGFQVEAVDDGQEAIELIGRGGVDLVLLDIVMPRLTGLEACRLLKSMTMESFLPVVLVTVKSDTANRVEGLKIGADDYVCKPFEEEELLARVGAMLRIKRLHDQVAAQRAYLEQLSIHDEMTGLYNYRYLFTRLNEEFKRAERYHEPFACVLVDIDRLKAMNDTGGRTLGDAVIRRVADGIRRSVREVDVVARYGGEEFLIVLPSTHFAGSLTVAERIWREASGNPVEFGGEMRPCSVSIGVSLYPSRDVRSKDALIRAAESALNQAKREGGNRICVFQQHGQIYTPTAAGEPQPPPSPGKLRRSSDPAFAATHAATDEPREPQTRRGADLPSFPSRKPL
ncbi:diguanylate cyclase [Sorangium sp. So ce375]|uniref:diguanylate cyclase n=1 Tax=Sorangium sp. So ce375 TaxID=3133306 RepID=UPI003F5B5A74